MTLSTPHLTTASRSFHTSPPIPPLKGGVVSGDGMKGNPTPNFHTLPHLSTPPCTKVGNGGNAPFMIRARQVANCHRAAVAAIHAAMWTPAHQPTRHAEMRAAILSRMNKEVTT